MRIDTAFLPKKLLEGFFNTALKSLSLSMFGEIMNGVFVIFGTIRYRFRSPSSNVKYRNRELFLYNAPEITSINDGDRSMAINTGPVKEGSEIVDFPVK